MNHTIFIVYFPDKWVKEYPGKRPYDIWASPRHAAESKADTDGFRVKVKVRDKVNGKADIFT